MSKNQLAQTICPLCGADNQCAVAAGNAPESCWCMTEELNQDAKDRAAAITDSRCICPACGRTPQEAQQ